MILSAVLGLLLVAPVIISQTPTLCYDNQLPCVTGAQCVNNRCQCSGSDVGNGRTYCAANRCVCSSIADPHLFLFSNNAQITANLPCSIYFSSYVGPACSVNVYLDTEQRGTGNARFFRVFAGQIRAKVFKFQSPQFSADLTANAQGAQSTNPTGVTISSQDGFAYADESNCGTRIGYNATYGAAYLSLPNNGFTYTEFCGNCTNAAPVGTTPDAQLSYLLKHVAPTADQSGAYNTECGNMQTTLSTCTSANRDTAANICLPYLDTFGQCLLNNSGFANYNAVLSAFSTCVANVCSGNTATACNALTALDTGSANCALVKPTSCP